MERISFGKSWFRAMKRLTELWDIQKAKTAHEQRRPYVAVMENSGGNHSFIEVNNDYFGIGFLDSHLREYLSYQFQELEPGRLFLTMATHREFDGETDRVSYGTTYYFKPDGSVTVETEDFATANLATKEMKVDVNGNWETYPNFGDYGSLTRVDR
jgi:hypothetical protein